ncbi:hypothetical protein HGA91_02450 [candidate division WWE3 bacterium]|nr:hypothetical protein [candidate division WWE3 bacterium]
MHPGGSVLETMALVFLCFMMDTWLDTGGDLVILDALAERTVKTHLIGIGFFSVYLTLIEAIVGVHVVPRTFIINAIGSSIAWGGVVLWVWTFMRSRYSLFK